MKVKNEKEMILMEIKKMLPMFVMDLVLILESTLNTVKNVLRTPKS